jgi:hypothetical protein
MAGSYLKEDGPFRHYKLKRRMIASIAMRLFDNASVLPSEVTRGPCFQRAAASQADKQNAA